MGHYTSTRYSSITVYKFSHISKFKEVNHFISNRKGGLSKAPYDSLNIGFNTADEEDIIFHNRKALGESIDIPLFRFTIADQTHSGNVTVVDQDMKGRGSQERADSIPDSDGLVTNVPGICLMAMMADCVPVILFDPVKKVIGVSHAGWRGILKRITRNTVDKMISEYGSNPADILAGIGPSIGPDCYEIGKDVENAIIETFGSKTKILIRKRGIKKNHLDLWRATSEQLLEIGLPEKNIERSNICTSCNYDMYFSYRKGSGVTGRFAAAIMLND